MTPAINVEILQRMTPAFKIKTFPKPMLFPKRQSSESPDPSNYAILNLDVVIPIPDKEGQSWIPWEDTKDLSEVLQTVKQYSDDEESLKPSSLTSGSDGKPWELKSDAYESNLINKMPPKMIPFSEFPMSSLGLCDSNKHMCGKKRKSPRRMNWPEINAILIDKTAVTSKKLNDSPLLKIRYDLHQGLIDP